MATDGSAAARWAGWWAANRTASSAAATELAGGDPARCPPRGVATAASRTAREASGAAELAARCPPGGVAEAAAWCPPGGVAEAAARRPPGGVAEAARWPPGGMARWPGWL